jgi:16S rRNA (adenine1518-N6/adenine1519-N6)-dimethyltransferase
LGIEELNVGAVLRRHGLRPKKKLGQNFLTDEAALARIVAAGEVGPQDTVLEIGPGVGSLTRHLARAAGRVLAVELDEQLIPILREVVAPFDNVQVVQGDILNLSPAQLWAAEPNLKLQTSNYKAVANIPYYITAPILRRLLETEPRPSLTVLTIQAEVAERLCARPGKMSVLAVSVQFYGLPEIVARIPASAFYPPPHVDSAVVRIRLREQPAVDTPDVGRFFRVVQAGFSQKRKQLKNSLSGGLRLPVGEVQAALLAAGVEPARRAETLSLEEWGQVERSLAEPLARA